LTKPSRKEPNLPKDEALERMNKALKKMLETPPETHDEMVRRRKSGGEKMKRKR
jgi:hypothetical protein